VPPLLVTGWAAIGAIRPSDMALAALAGPPQARLLSGAGVQHGTRECAH
jgi:hypothetical protein